MPRTRTKQRKKWQRKASTSRTNNTEPYYLTNRNQDQFEWWIQTVADIKMRMLEALSLGSGLQKDLVKICYDYVPAEDAIHVRTVGRPERLNLGAFSIYIKNGLYTIPVECNRCQTVSREVVAKRNVSARCSPACVKSHGICQICSDCIRQASASKGWHGHYEICGFCSKILLNGDTEDACFLAPNCTHSYFMSDAEFDLLIDPESIK